MEITENEYRNNVHGDWDKIKEQLLKIDNRTVLPVNISDWNFEKQRNFLQDKIPNITGKQCRELIKKFGKTPKDLTRLVELINYGNIYEHTPIELIFQDVMLLDTNAGDNLDIKCLEFLQLKNSYILYIYSFLILFGGEVDRTFIENFKSNINWVNECYALLGKSNLFSVKINFVSVENLKTFENLKSYYERIAPLNIMQEVVAYVKENSDKLQLSKESLLELQVNIAYYSDLQECVYLLVQLGDSYLHCEQIRKAQELFERAFLIKENEDIEIDDIQELRMLIGLIKTYIWKTISAKSKIEKWIKLADEIINTFASEDIVFLQLKLKFYLLCYQFNHSLGNIKAALESTKAGINLIEKYDLYHYDMPGCGTMWRFYAIAVKEDTQNIEECLKIFQIAEQKCPNNAKIMFGHIIHKNMNIKEPDFMRCLQKKLDNYKSLTYVNDDLSIEEYLHYTQNMAALYFNLKKYDEAWKIYAEILQKSAIFGISREQIRILNDMANIEWIKGNINAAEKKYSRAIETAKEAGYYHNYWPILLNYMSLNLFQGNFERALIIQSELLPHIEEVCKKLVKGKLSSETFEYYRAVIIIYIRNLWSISQNIKTKSVLSEIKQILDMSKLFNSDKMYDASIVKNKLTLENTMYEHKTLSGETVYLIKD